MRVTFLVICFIALAACSCPKWKMYKQCDDSWGSHQLGTSSTQTICTAGCAMSSVAMGLASYSEKISGDLVNPGNLNKWLKNNNGYANTDLIVWSSVDKLGKVHFKEEVGSLSASDLAKFVNKCYPVIVNVRSGTHWVLVTGTTSNKNTFKVNDPYFSNTTYDLSDMSEFVVYNLSGSSIVGQLFTLAKDNTDDAQDREALVIDAEQFE